jgi:hypothetical protein
MQFHIVKTLSLLAAVVVAAAAVVDAQDSPLGNGNNTGNGNGRGKGKGGGTAEKVAVCHKNRFTLYLPQQAVAGHMRHGDSVGECAVTPSAGTGKGKGGLRPDGGLVTVQEN